MKFFKIFIVSVLVISLCCINGFALSGTTYSDQVQSNTNTQNLISYAMTFDSFISSDFVCYRSGDYSYYIVWGNLDYSGSYITGSDIEYISYIRSGSSYDYQYYYTYGTDTTFSLNVQNTVTSNIEGCGMYSALYEEYYNQHYSELLLIIILSLVFVVALTSLRGNKS